MLADSAEDLFEHDWDLENEYHTMLDGTWLNPVRLTH